MDEIISLIKKAQAGDKKAYEINFIGFFFS